MEHGEVPISRTEHQHEIDMPKAVKEVNDLPLPVNSCLPFCAFSKQDNNASESVQRSKAAVKLFGLITFYLIFMVVEIVGGVKANSLAVLTDAAHLLSDVAGCFIALFALWASGWEATSHQSFGFSRVEVLGALLSVQLIWLISGILIYEAVNRILHKSALVNGKLMFVIAAFGFTMNLIMVRWLGHNHAHHACGDKGHIHEGEELCALTEEEKANLVPASPAHNHTHHACHDKGHNHEEELCLLTNEEDANRVSTSPEKIKMLSLNINLQGAYLHVMADLIQSIGVMIAGAIIWAKPDWLVVDLVCTLIFSVLVLSTTIGMLRNIFGILMERTPKEIDIVKLEKGLRCIKGVEDIHDLHVWAITVGKTVLSCHVIAEPGVNSKEILHRIRDYCWKTCRIQHVTIQIE